MQGNLTSLDFSDTEADSSFLRLQSLSINDPFQDCSGHCVIVFAT